MSFFSARLLLVVLVNDGRPRRTNTWDEVVVTFRARDFGHALVRALDLGRSHETAYPNAAGHEVRWAFVEVETLDRVGRRLDGAEVASRLSRRRSKSVIPFKTRFHPERSVPGQTFCGPGPRSATDRSRP